MTCAESVVQKGKTRVTNPLDLILASCGADPNKPPVGPVELKPHFNDAQPLAAQLNNTNAWARARANTGAFTPEEIPRSLAIGGARRRISRRVEGTAS